VLFLCVTRVFGVIDLLLCRFDSIYAGCYRTADITQNCSSVMLLRLEAPYRSVSRSLYITHVIWFYIFYYGERNMMNP